MKKTSPYIIITASFLITILIGSILLSLPISKAGSGSFKYIDALLTSTSAVTITGFSPFSNLGTSLSLFGKIILLILVQIGGLSIVTLSVFIMVLIGSNIGISNRVLIKETFNQDSLSGMVKLVVRIVMYTLIIQAIGFLINLIVFIPEYDFWDAVGISAFHAISSFNNAGFDLFGTTSLINYSNNILLNISSSLLIILGGLGFIVVNDLLRKKSYKKLSIHSKIIIKVNLFLWSFGMILIKISEGSSITWLQSFFLSISARTSGLTTVNLNTISSATILILLILMFIGGSPASTSGGIKTTTAYSLYKSVTSYASGKTAVTSGRKISKVTKEKATVILTSALFVVLTATLVLLLFENMPLEKALFKTISAFSNTGFTMGLTPLLKTSSKILISLLMIIGRVGILTIISIFNLKWYKHGMENIDYIEENIMIG